MKHTDYIGFTGDLFPYDSISLDPFENIREYLSNVKIVVNLESPFIPETCVKEPIKNKITLKQDNKMVKIIKNLDPFLVNLSNNHINDFGNFGVKNTFKVLSSENINYFGAGYEDEEHNIYKIENLKVVIISYTTRETDLTGNKLFNNKKFMGPKEFSFEDFKKQTNKYKDYIKIVLFHWGHEQLHYPLPEQRKIARDVINAGADLIVGNHSHTIQGFEKISEKWVFYSLGNFLFPDFYLKTKYGKFIVKQKLKNRFSIVPIFKIENRNITLTKILTLKQEKDLSLKIHKKKKAYNRFLFSDDSIYSQFYKIYLVYNFIHKVCSYPFRKIVKCLSKENEKN